MAEFIYTMQKARKAHGDKVILDDVTLAFYPGAKIGVVGPNGAGKSTVLRIMAGIDDGVTGEAQLTRGFSVGYLEQEPKLDPAKDVLGNVMDGVGEVAALLHALADVGCELRDQLHERPALRHQIGLCRLRLGEPRKHAVHFPSDNPPLVEPLHRGHARHCVTMP